MQGEVHQNDTPSFVAGYGDEGPGNGAGSDRDEARPGPRRRHHANLERAHRTVLPPWELPLGAPRSGSV